MNSLSLLDQRYAPLTFSIGFLELPFRAVAQGFHQWYDEIYERVDVVDFELPLAEALQSLAPLTTFWRRQLLLSTRSAWTAYFDNAIRGADPAGPVGYIASRMHCRGLVVSNIPNTLHGAYARGVGTYGAVTFELFAAQPTDFLNYRRTIAAVNDGGRWRFITSGPPLPFEEPAAYTVRRVASRFTADMLGRYCRALGIDVFDADFYGPAGIRMEITQTLDPDVDVEAIDLATARARLGLT